jgi:hypothetical protein
MPNLERLYRSLEHIGYAVWGARYSEKGLFAMLTCYHDEAGGDDHAFIIVSCFVASVNQWNQFEDDWRIFLASHDVPYLHMKEFAHFKGPFAKFEKQEGTRKKFIAQASAIMCDRIQHAFSCYVNYDAFQKLNSEYELDSLLNSPYAFAGRGCIALVNDWRLKSSNDLDMEYVFEEGGPDKGGLINAVTKLQPYLPIPIFKPSRDTEIQRGVVQLQAADYLAYEMRKWVSDLPKFRARERLPRVSLGLLSPIEHNWIFEDETRLEELCRKAGVKRRPLAVHK